MTVPLPPEPRSAMRLPAALLTVAAIVAAFVPLTMMNVPLLLVVLGIIAGLAMMQDKIVLAAQGCPTQAIELTRDGARVV